MMIAIIVMGIMILTLIGFIFVIMAGTARDRQDRIVACDAHRANSIYWHEKATEAQKETIAVRRHVAVLEKKLKLLGEDKAV